MKTMIENLINGNLTDAKKQARGFSMSRISDYLHFALGWSYNRSAKAAYYLKTGTGFQAYCDAK